MEINATKYCCHPQVSTGIKRLQCLLGYLQNGERSDEEKVGLFDSFSPMFPHKRHVHYVRKLPVFTTKHRSKYSVDQAYFWQYMSCRCNAV